MTRVTTAGLGIAALALSLTATAACGREPARETATTPPAATEARSDSAISTEVQSKFYDNDMIRGRRIDVSAENGVVTLRGEVPSEDAKQQAVNLARGVEGVTSVNDQLQVQAATQAAAESRPQSATGTAGREDDASMPSVVTTKIQAKYFMNPGIKPWNIDVTTASGGVVTLEGAVDSAEDKAEALRIARETEGVTRVEDKLRVESGERTAETAKPAEETPGTGMRPDAWLTAKIQAKYFVDDEVKARNIDVDTNNGVVTLKGAVSTEAERRQAVALARNTDGVRDVTDELRIDPSISSMEEKAEGAARETKAAAKDATRETREKAGDMKPVAALERPDPWITMKIQAKYFLDADVKGHEINVDTNNGVVTLKGSVENAQQKQEAEQIARETEGVKRVVNQLTVATAAAAKEKQKQ